MEFRRLHPDLGAEVGFDVARSTAQADIAAPERQHEICSWFGPCACHIRAPESRSCT